MLATALPTRMWRAVKGRQHRQMAALVGIAQGKAKQFAARIAHMEFGAVAGFQQRNTGESGFGCFNATVGLHDFFSLLRVTFVVTRLRKAHSWLLNS
jgi:hypothetical protein